MAYASSGSSSSSDSEVDSCSKTCVKAYVSLKEQYDSLNSDYNKSQFNLLSYKAGLESVETRLAHYKKNEAVFEENINVLKLEVRLRDNALDEYKQNQITNKYKTGLGYNAVTSTEKFVTSTEMVDNQEQNKGYHVVPVPYTGNYIPSKPDIMFLDEVIESEHLDVITVVTPSNAQKDEIVHESVNDESEVDVIPRVMNKTMRSSYDEIKFVKSASEIVEKSNPQQQEYKQKGVFDSGCSRHMTGNKCFLSEYEDHDGGFVCFGDGKGRISGKGKIKSGTLVFDDVNFFLSSDFKLPDESQVLVRVLGKDNIYSVDLKSVVPTKGLTCLLDRFTE
ncbi:hypothetical protein Tco_0355838 [Tanacetum coccineum]